jgi:adenine-specific DNA-methyltransferase
LARDLLTEDGVILVNINDENRALLELMLDQTLPGMKIGSLVWRSRTGGNDTEGPFLSVNHEHVLVYANPGFRFGGTGKSFERYINPEKDPRGVWTSADLTKAHTRIERPNSYYPLINPQTGIVYPANPDQVWRFVSKRTGGARKDGYIEDLIEQDRIKWPTDEKVVTWDSLEDLQAAILAGNVPRSGKTAFLFESMPGLADFVGKPVGFGTPRYKRFKSELKNNTQPLSSWITPKSEAKTALPDDNAIVSGTNDEGTKALKAIFGAKVFNYPKPLSLIRELIRQASAPGDIVLDFFAGSATTAHAVMELNAEDMGDRRFIMISHDEATETDRGRNICRDVTARRIRLLNETALKTGKGSVAPFAYLRTH